MATDVQDLVAIIRTAQNTLMSDGHTAEADALHSVVTAVQQHRAPHVKGQHSPYWRAIFSDEDSMIIQAATEEVARRILVETYNVDLSTLVSLKERITR
jgi:hypothetical protein